MVRSAGGLGITPPCSGDQLCALQKGSVAVTAFFLRLEPFSLCLPGIIH